MLTDLCKFIQKYLSVIHSLESYFNKILVVKSQESRVLEKMCLIRKYNFIAI